MSGVNPNIPLQFAPTQFPGVNVGNAVGTAGQLLGFQQAQKQVQDQTALRSILGSPAALDASGNPTPDAIKQIMAVSPDIGMKLHQNMLVQQENTLRQSVYRTEAFGKKLEMAHQAYAPVLETYEDALKDGNTPEQAATIAQNGMDDANKSLMSGGFLSEEEQKRLPTKFDPLKMRQFVTGYPGYQNWRKQQLQEQKEKHTEDRDDERDKLARDRDAHKDQIDAERDKLARDRDAHKDQIDAERDKLARDHADSTGWTVMSDPGNKDATGNPVQYRYHPGRAEATTLDGKPYTPSGAAKLSGNSGAPPDDKPMSDDGVAYAGTMYRNKGTLPQFGNSRYAVADRKRIIDWAANRSNKNVDAAGEDVVSQAGVKADAASLAQTTRYRNQVESFEETAQQSANLIRSLAPKGLGPTGVPVVDSWMQAGRRAIGDADVVKFGNAIDTFTSEYAKIMSGATGAAGSTDSARAKAEGLINKAQNAQQLYGALDVMQQEMNIRRKSLTDQEAQIRKELGETTGRHEPAAAPQDKPKPEAAPPAKKDAADIQTFGTAPDDLAKIATLPKGTKFKGADGKIYTTTAEPKTSVATPPALPSGVPPGSAYSPSRNMWRAPDGKLYDAAGQPAGGG